MALNDRLFQAFALAFPTERLGQNPLGAIWRIVFNMLRPSEPFVMKTADYRLWAWPKTGNLTRSVALHGPWKPTLTRIFTP